MPAIIIIAICFIAFGLICRQIAITILANAPAGCEDDEHGFRLCDDCDNQECEK